MLFSLNLSQEGIMRRYDLSSSLFWLMFAILIMIGSLRLPMGTVGNPGSGFFPLVIGCLLGLTSLILLIYTIQRNFIGENPFSVDKRKGYIIITTILSLLIYTIALTRLGFLFTAFLLLLFLFKVIGKLNWKISLGGATLSALFYYILFVVLLKIEFPVGWLGM
jgi:hypothetical protein